jgi:hypothetical protein
MSVIDDLRNRWEGMDEVDRRNFWIGVGFFILVILLIYSLMNTMDSLSNALGGGAKAVNNNLNDIQNLRKP